MASGTPVIASRVDGLNDIILHGKNGLLADYNDDHTLSTHIIDVLTNKKTCHKLIQHGFYTIDGSYNWRSIMGDVLNTYQSVGAGKY